LKIGIVLSKPPAYSETFFISKIKGLIDSGFEVILFVQKRDDTFSLCKVIQAPRVFKKKALLILLSMVFVFVKLGITRSKRVLRFITLERNANRSNFQILKNIYNKAHILQADLDWLHFGFATMALQSELVAKAINAKMAVSLRGFDIDVYPLKHPGCYDLLWMHVDKVHAISNYLLEKAYKQGLSREVAHQIINPAVDITKFKIRKAPSTNTLKILTIGRLHWIKGIIYTLEALALLKLKGVLFYCTIIGEGPDYEDIAFAIHQLGLKKEVNLLGKLPHDTIVDYLSVTDLYIQYSISEGFCNAVLEAQSMGGLCIVSDGGALPENIIHGKTGWVVPKRNPKELVKAILEVINLPEEKKLQIRGNAHQRIVDEFNIEKQQKEYVDFYSI